MPSVVHASSKLNALPWLTLSKQSASENLSGLVTTQCEFVCLASNQHKVDKFFYLDAPPPIWPSSLNRSRLMSGKLFLSERNFQRENGMTHISATYVGGLNAATTNNKTFVYQRKGSYKSYSYVSPPFTMRTWNRDNPSNQVEYTGQQINIQYTYRPIHHVVQYVRINGVNSANYKPKGPFAILIKYYGAAPQIYPGFDQYGWTTITKYIYPKKFFERILNNRPLLTEEKITPMTPSVFAVEETFYIE